MSQPRLHAPVLCIITEGATQLAMNRIREALAGGATMVQLRCAPETAPAEIVGRGRRLRELTSEAGAALIVNDHVELVDPIGADGAHVGPLDMPPSQARDRLGPDRIVGYSVRAVSQLTDTLQENIDYVGAGPIFPTASKLDAGDPIGLDGLREIAALARLPVIAIGGILEMHVANLARCGATGIATISMLDQAKDPAALCQRVLTALSAPPS